MWFTRVMKLNKHFGSGVMPQSSYTYSKLMTDADSFSGSRAVDAARPETHARDRQSDYRRLLKHLRDDGETISERSIIAII